MTEPTKQPRRPVYFSIPMGWREMKPEDRHAHAKAIAARIIAQAPAGALSPKS